MVVLLLLESADNLWELVVDRLIPAENVRGLYRIDIDGKIVQGLGTRSPSSENERTVVSIINAIGNDEAKTIFGDFTLMDELYRRVPKTWMSDHVTTVLEEMNDAKLLFAHIHRAWDSAQFFLNLYDVNEPFWHVTWQEQVMAVPCSPGSPLERVFHRIMMTTDSNGSQKLSSLRRRFRYTKKAKLSKAQRTDSIEAEANLKSLWEGVERVLQEGNALSEDVKAVLADVEPLVTSPDSGASSTSASVKPASAQPFVPIPAAQPGDLVARRVPRTLIDLQAEARKRVTTANIMKDIDGPADAPEPEEGHEWPKILLGPDEYTTVGHLLGTSNEARPGEIDWTDIVALMNAIGFTGPRTHPGSARSFVPGEALKRDQVSTSANELGLGQ